MAILELGDFFQHPLVTPLLGKLIEDQPGLILVSGPDRHPLLPGVSETEQNAQGGILPSGRKMIFNSLLESLLQARPNDACVYVTAGPAEVRPSRSVKRQVQVLSVENEQEYGKQIAQAMARKPGLLAIDALNEHSATMALTAAQQGLRVLVQLDSLLVGEAAKRHILTLGVTANRLNSLRWVISVRRVPAICPRCRQPVPITPGLSAFLQDTVQNSPEALAFIQNPAFYTAAGCQECRFTGRSGDIAVCDIYQAPLEPLDQVSPQPSLLPMQSYLAFLALRGLVAVQDWLGHDADQVLNLYALFRQRDQAYQQLANQKDAKLAELVAAHRVLEQRTRSLVSLQTIAQTLLMASGLNELAGQICRQVCDLCHCERSALYVRGEGGRALLLAASGWPNADLPVQVEEQRLPGFAAGMQPSPYRQPPPGIEHPAPGAPAETLKAGLCIPLIAQASPVGWVMIHTTRRPAFLPGETALLQTFASQAALALQRAGLVAQLEKQIAALEAAQAELAQKERMEHELELARQVQQSVLPTIFPAVPGFRFGAMNAPARQVGGDFYDVIRLDNDHLGLAIADVSDKGMPAALYMTLTRSLLLAEGRRSLSPLNALHQVNRLLLELGNANMFVTVFYGVVECSSRLMRYARAGHERPLLLRGAAAIELGGEGIPLGLFDDETFCPTEEQISLEPNDRLVLYTDGLVDVIDPAGQIFDRSPLIRLMTGFAAHHPGELCTAVFDALEQFQGSSEQTDDMTMLVMEVG